MLRIFTIILCFVLLLIQPLALAAVTRVGSESSALESTTPAATVNLAHTVPSGTDLLIFVACMVGNRAFSGVPNWNTTETMTEIAASAATSSGDVDIGVWGLVSPTAATDDVTVSWTNGDEPYIVLAINYDGVDVTDVATATNVSSTDDNNATPTADSVHSSAGSSGNALLHVGCGLGDDMVPASNNASFTEILDAGTGGGSSINEDLSGYVAELLSGLPSAITVTYAVTDENYNVLIELVAAAGDNPLLRRRR